MFEQDSEELIEDGDKSYWLGSEVTACEMCGKAVVAVDNCGEFGNSLCPQFGKDRDKSPYKSGVVIFGD